MGQLCRLGSPAPPEPLYTAVQHCTLLYSTHCVYRQYYYSCPAVLLQYLASPSSTWTARRNKFIRKLTGCYLAGYLYLTKGSFTKEKGFFCFGEGALSLLWGGRNIKCFLEETCNVPTFLHVHVRIAYYPPRIFQWLKTETNICHDHLTTKLQLLDSLLQEMK